jgi:hypothetical protein
MTGLHGHMLADYLADAGDAYGLPERSGGHTWTEGTQGRVCTHCGQRWAEVVGATDEAIQQPHYAHDGKLAEWEQKEFVREVDWLWSTIIDAASAGH